MTLPNFLIIGAPRSGTTSLHHYLRQHPDVFMPEGKEPSFFAFVDQRVPAEGPGAEWFQRSAVTSRAEYEALFADARTPAIGEASPVYLIEPAAPARMRELIPAAKLIAILRHPVERAHAAYLGSRRDGQDPARTFEEAVRDEEARLRRGWRFARHVNNGMYHRLLTGYYEAFPREQIRVYLFEDLVRDARAVLRDLFAFIGADPEFVPDLSRRYGATGLIRNPVLSVLWRNSEVPRRVVRDLLPVSWRDRAFEWVTRDQVKPSIAPELRAELIEHYRPDILALQTLIGRDLSVWLR